MRNSIKLVTIGAILFLAPWAWLPTLIWKVNHLHAFGLSLPFILKYVAANLLGIAATILVPFSRTILRVPLGLFLALSFTIDFLLKSIVGAPADTQMFLSMLQAKDEAGHAVGTYPAEIAMGAILFVAILPGLLMKPTRELKLNWAAVVVLLAAFGLTCHILSDYHGRIEEFPSTIATSIKAHLAFNQSNSLYLGARDELVYEEPLALRVEKVVLIVDESIRGDYLQLNDDSFDNTPFLSSHTSELANFGAAVANANCSALARLALRSGVRDTDYPDPGQRVLHQPTFWQYAKAAGYRTIYIDGWLPLRKMHSFITYEELKYVDERMEVDLRPYWDADNKVSDKLIEALSQPGKAFIFVEKIGLHSPYKTATAGYNSGYEPAPSSIPTPDLPDDQKNDVLQYSKGVHLRVDNFFARAWHSLQQHDVLTIYTSDHGQSMYEGGYRSSHCTGANAVKGEGLVPIILTTGNKDVLSKFQLSAQRSFGQANHNDIFPTLISAMGYNPDAVSPPYSPGLINVATDRQRSFIVGSPFRKTVDRVAVDDGPAEVATTR